MNKTKKIERLSRDILDEDFIDVFKSIFIFQRIFGLLSVNITYKYITETSKLYKLFVMSLWTVNVLCLVDYILNYRTSFDVATDSMLKLVMSVNVTTNALIVWRNNFKLNTLKSQIYVKLQNLDRDLKTKDAVTMNKKLSALSIALMICGFIWCTIWLFVYNAIAMNTFCVPLTIILSANVGNWLEMVLLFIIFYFVNVRAEYVNKLLRRRLNQTECPDRVFLIQNAKPSDTVSREFICGMQSLLEIIGNIKDIYQFPVSTFI